MAHNGNGMVDDLNLELSPAARLADAVARTRSEALNVNTGPAEARVQVTCYKENEVTNIIAHIVDAMKAENAIKIQQAIDGQVLERSK